MLIVLKDGDVSWSCLEKTCNASIRSDAKVTVVSVTNDKHAGQHPITLRRMSAAASPANSPASQAPALATTLNTPLPTPSPAALTTPSTPAHYNTPIAISTNTSFSSTNRFLTSIQCCKKIHF
ncbi:hypothetical protein J6590_069045 [Homalodisca vitripennis]|nr:hypothetical protein J6590_069045 [Homalodisca vitripennis]